MIANDGPWQDCGNGLVRLFSWDAYDRETEALRQWYLGLDGTERARRFTPPPGPAFPGARRRTPSTRRIIARRRVARKG